MRSLLWVGDACVASGFARATHHTLEVLRRTWDVTVLGLNHNGDPQHQYPYDVYPCWPGGDSFGTGRIGWLAKKVKADCIVIQNDVWNIPAYMQALAYGGVSGVPVVGSLAVDGRNCQGRALNGLTAAFFWTRFGEEEARKGGYEGPSAVIPLGVDLNVYRPMDRLQARKMLELLPGAKSNPTNGAFIVGNVNRNQQRKRFDLMVEYFCDWVEQRDVKDAYLMLHACPTGDQEFDVEQLMEWRGMRDRLVFIQPNIGQGVPEVELAVTYSLFDVMLTTTQGEGFGLTTLEGMACGVPQIVPDYAALGEICEDAALKVPCTTFGATQRRINVIGALADRALTVEALDRVYRDESLRADLRRRGLALAAKPCYRWENVGQSFSDALDAVLDPKTTEAMWRDLGRPEEKVGESMGLSENIIVEGVTA